MALTRKMIQLRQRAVALFVTGSQLAKFSFQKFYVSCKFVESSITQPLINLF